jgi:hypothetical protein
VTGGFDAGHWQPALDGETSFGSVAAGAAAALVSREDWDRSEGVMLEWRAKSDGHLAAATAGWRGAQSSGVDVVFVADDAVFSDILGAGPHSALRNLRDGVRTGDVVLFITKCQSGLRDAGWEDFLESMGLAFMGACR